MLMDATFWAFIALLLFFGLLLLMKIPRMITSALDERAAKITAALEDARSLREEAQQLLIEFQKKRKEKEKEASEIVEAAKIGADIILKEAKKKTDEFILRQTILVEKKIAFAEREAIEELKTAMIEMAIQKARKSLH